MTLTADNTPDQLDPAVVKAQRMQRLLDASSFGTDDAREAQLEGARLLGEFAGPEEREDLSSVEEELGKQAEASGQLAQAESHYISAMRWSTTRPRVLRLALLYLQLGVVSRGVPHLVSVIDGNNRAGAVYLLATLVHDAGERDVGDALGVLGRSRLDVRTLSRLEYLEAMTPRRALKVARDAEEPRMLFISGCSSHLRGEYQDAYFFYSAAMKLNHPMGLIGVASLFRRNREWSRRAGFPAWRSARELIASQAPRTFSEQRRDLEDSARTEPEVLTIDERGVGGGDDRVAPGDFDKLVERAVGRDGMAVHNLLRIVRPLVLSYCRARLSTFSGVTSAEDVAQETCLAVLKALPSYQQDSRPFLAFVYGIAAHKVVDAHRSVSRSRADAVAEIPEEVSLEAGPEEKAVRAVDAQADAEVIRGLLVQLPHRQREVLTLRVVVGLSVEETAEACDLTPGAVRVAQHRALTKLRHLIEAKDSAEAEGAGGSEAKSVQGAAVSVRGAKAVQLSLLPLSRRRAI